MAEDIRLVATVVSATYNRFDRLGETIVSVINQTYRPIEYIICDDGSNNFPVERVLSLTKNVEPLVTVRIIQNEHNIGTVRNLNNAYKISNGDVIINLSCGDVFFNSDTVSRIMKSFTSSDCRLLATSRIAYTKDFVPLFYMPNTLARHCISRYDTQLKQLNAFVTRHYYDMLSGSAMAVRSSVIKELGYLDENFILWEDGPLFYRYLHVDKVEFDFEVPAVWYESDGISSKSWEDKNPLLAQDEVRFHDLVLSNAHEFDWITRRRILYTELLFRRRCGGVITARDYVKYVPEFLYYKVYGLQRRFFRLVDSYFAKRDAVNKIMKGAGAFDAGCKVRLPASWR